MKNTALSSLNGSHVQVEISRLGLRIIFDGGVRLELSVPSDDLAWWADAELAWMEADDKSEMLHIAIRAPDCDGFRSYIFCPQTNTLLPIDWWVFGRPNFFTQAGKALYLVGSDPFRPAGLLLIDGIGSSNSLIFHDDDKRYFYRLQLSLEHGIILLVGKSTASFKVYCVLPQVETVSEIDLGLPDEPRSALVTLCESTAHIAVATQSEICIYSCNLGSSPISTRLLWTDPNDEQYLYSLTSTQDHILLISGRDADFRLRAIGSANGNCIETETPAYMNGCSLSFRNVVSDKNFAIIQIENPMCSPVPGIWQYLLGICQTDEEHKIALQQHKFLSLEFNTSDNVSVGVSIWSPTVSTLSTNERPCLVSCYGAYGRPPPLGFITWTTRLETTAYILVHIRGGGDRGMGWHKAGCGTRRRRSVDDFAEALNWLQLVGQINSDKTTFYARSAGAVSVGSVLAENPHLATAAIFEYPLLDLVAAMSSGDALSQAECDEWSIETCCPTQLLTRQEYPPVFVLSGGSDWRTASYQIQNWASKFADMNVSSHSVTWRNNQGIGHGVHRNNPVQKEIDLEIEAFLRRVLSFPF